MSYLALYRKWRPTDFTQVKGQDTVVRTLRNQIIYDRIGHAYLFCGTRGTGKTSIAKLFAKAVNCETPQDGNPCGVCKSCQALADPASMDVIEIDAASNNGVDHIRQIREQVQYTPIDVRYKVYIIDEVHMLSPGAFNALLKTLEEPPSYVIFILATTEKHRIPVTILSRCQQYDFHRITVDTITDHLAELMKKEEIKVDPKGLQFIARTADGSMRDALSLLDQCLSFYMNQELTYDKIVEVLGAADTLVYSNLLSAVTKKDVPKVLEIIDKIIMDGLELSRFLNDFLWYLRNLLLLKDQEAENELIPDLTSENLARMREETTWLTTGELLNMIRTLSDLSSQLRLSTQKRILLEVGFIKLCRPDMNNSTDALLARIERLEEDLANQPVYPPAYHPEMAGGPGMGGPGSGSYPGQPIAGPTGQTISQTISPKENTISPEEALKERFTPAEAEDLRKIASSWKRIVGSTANPMRGQLKEATIAVADDSSTLQLVFDETNERSANAKLYFEKNNHEKLDLLSEIVAKRTGKQTTFQCVMKSPGERRDEEIIDLSKIHMKVTME